jgi:hypothetical protein
MTVQMYGVYSGRPTTVQLFSSLERQLIEGWSRVLATLITARTSADAT